MKSLKTLIQSSSLAVLLALTACGGTNEEATDDLPSDDPAMADGYADILAAKKNAASKADELVTCGNDTCEPKLCGYDCSVAGQQCQRACAQKDSRPESYITLRVEGAATQSVDTRAVPYRPVLSLTKVLFYGCNLWDFTGGAYDGLALQYSEIFKGAFTTSETSDMGIEFQLYTKPFTGAGTYKAEASFSPSTAARSQGELYAASDACSMTVQGDGQGGLTGTFRCASLPNKNGTASVTASGEFACGNTAIDGPMIVRMP